MGYSLEDRRNGVRIPGRPEILFGATQQSEWVWQPPAVGLKRAAREADHSFYPDTDVKA